MRKEVALLLSLASFSAALEPAEFFGANNDDYVEWFERVNYDGSLFLPSNDASQEGAAVHWSIDETHLSLAVAVRASGWMGFGLSENGGMQGSDVFLWEASQPDTITDAHILEE